ncbi:DUF3784 domain-containing protein [Caminicella sporogenes]|uniref:DUF3784 domain-containing protein n=1 Tax=Caminicella sporogenes TaxID=166485 RepID=UPI0025404EB6|nr:DUF3784 domain-containing protein [Caminicella sporogenes]WIF95892.1 DUF3784 domain-containing protein [Caminicella sporogenes]
MKVANIIFAIVGIFNLLIGILLYKYNMVEMLAGYDKNKIIDKEGLAKWTGVNFILMGLAIIVISVIGLVLNFNTILFFIITVVGLCVRMIIGNKKYEKTRN